MFCKNCGNSIIEGEKFCNKCGQSIDVVQVAQTEPVNQVVQPIPNTYYNNIQPSNFQPPKKKNGWTIALIVIGVILLLLFIIGRAVLYFSGESIESLIDNITENINTDNDDTNIEEDNIPVENVSIDKIYGEWLYEETGGSYVFSEDGTYKFYLTDDHTDGYVNGGYDLRYGSLARSGADTFYKYFDSEGNMLFDLTTYPVESKLDGVTKTYVDNEGALEFVLTLMQDNEDEMNIYNESSQSNFTVVRK